MLEATAYLSTGFFFALLVFYTYRRYDKQNSPKPQRAEVPLRVDRQALLDQKRSAVAERRKKLGHVVEPLTEPPQPTHNSAKSKPNDPPDESGDGFGEDLGAALTMSLKQEQPKRTSRFKALEDAASELKEVYNQNNTIHP